MERPGFGGGLGWPCSGRSGAKTRGSFLDDGSKLASWRLTQTGSPAPMFMPPSAVSVVAVRQWRCRRLSGAADDLRRPGRGCRSRSADVDHVIAPQDFADPGGRAGPARRHTGMASRRGGRRSVAMPGRATQSACLVTAVLQWDFGWPTIYSLRWSRPVSAARWPRLARTAFERAGLRSAGRLSPDHLVAMIIGVRNRHMTSRPRVISTYPVR